MIPSDALDEFPSAIDKFEVSHGREGLTPAADGFWLLYKNGNGLAAFDDDGYVHFPDNRPPLALMHRFKKLENNIDALAVNLVADFLAVSV